MKRVLIGFDAGGLAREALSQGLMLADRLGAQAHVVHAVEVPPVLLPGIDKTEILAFQERAVAGARESVMRRLQDACREAQYEAASPEEMLKVAPGHPADVLLRLAKNVDADLIVLGPHEKRSLLDFGNTTRAVVSEVAVPVWVQTGPTTEIKKIVVPVDFGEHSKYALKRARDLAQALGADIQVLHAYSPPAFAYPQFADESLVPTYVVDGERDASRQQLQRLMDDTKWQGVKATSKFVEGRIRSVIVDNIGDADLVVMGTHGRTGLSRFLLGSVAYEVLKRAEKPVLLVPDPERTWLLEGRGESVQKPGH